MLRLIAEASQTTSRLWQQTDLVSYPTKELTLVEPTKQLRIGAGKARQLKRAQDTIETIAWTTVLAVVVMFFVDGGAAQVVDWATGMNALSRLTALVGTDLLLIHMLLVARVPWIDKFYGHDKATVAHKQLGKPILYLVVAHFIASLAEFTISNAESIWATFIWLVFEVPDMLLAFTSLVLMIVVVVTSLNIARKKLRYEAWFIVHLLSYAAVLAAVPHVFSAGSDVAGKPVATVFWITLYVFVAVNIIWYRVLVPLIKSYRSSLKIAHVESAASDSVSIYLSGKNISRMGGQSGQFYMLRLLTWKQWWRPHPFSISAAPNGSFIRFTIGNRGDDTALLMSAKPGTRVLLEGPYGVFTEERRTKEKVVLIASGIGIPPVRALAESMAARPGDVTIIYRVRNESDAALLDEIKEIASRRSMQLHVVAGPRGKSDSWLNGDLQGLPDQARLTMMTPWVSDSDVYVCGPQAWTESVIRSLRRAGTPDDQIHAEEYAW
jgi:predicted ferric reductase